MRKPLVIALIALLVLAVAGGVAYTLLPKSKPALAEPPRAEGDEKTGGGEQAAAPKRCLDVEPKPVRYKFNDPNFPTGKLGEWYEVKNEKGQTILRVKVDLKGADYVNVAQANADGIGLGVMGLFDLTIDNPTCQTFAWKARDRQGMWVGVHPPGNNPLSSGETVGWYDSDEVLLGMPSFYIVEDGKYHFAPNGHPALELIEKTMTEERMLSEFPKEFPPGITSGEFYLEINDILGVSNIAAVGPDDSGKVPLVLGGYMGFAKIDLGNPVDWFKRFIGDPQEYVEMQKELNKQLNTRRK